MSAAMDLCHLPARAADLIERVGWTQGTERDGKGRVCLTGALRYCDPQPGDWLLAREVFRAKHQAEGWNDADGRTCDEVIELLRSTEITVVELAQTFGPSWETVVNLVHQAATLTAEQLDGLAAARDAAWDAAGAAAGAAAWDAARAATIGAAAGAAARAAATRDLIDQYGFTQEHYDLLTRPWRTVVGPLHPDDADLRVTAEATPMSTLTVLDWPRLLDTPTTRWYLDREAWGAGQCIGTIGCPDPVVAYAEYEVATLPGDSVNDGWHSADPVCAAHLPAIITHATGEPLVAGTVVEVGMDPALLRLTGVDAAVVARFNDGALGVSA
jgi:hypothetical protein